MIRAWIERGPQRAWKNAGTPNSACASDYDLRAGEPLAARTIAGFAPLIAGSGRVRPSRRPPAGTRLAHFRGQPRSPLAPPSQHEPRRTGLPPEELLAGSRLARDELAALVVAAEFGTKRSGRPGSRATPSRSSLDGCFGEYYEPFTGEALGSDDQSWTAAVALDWLADEGPNGEPA